MVLKGSQHTGFAITRGIRQGCPLSPLLFAVVADALLRALEHACPGDLVRAFADDTAMVVADVFGSASTPLWCFPGRPDRALDQVLGSVGNCKDLPTPN